MPFRALLLGSLLCFGGFPTGCTKERIVRESENEWIYHAIEIDGVAWFAADSGSHCLREGKRRHVKRGTKATITARVKKDTWIGTTDGLFEFSPIREEAIPILEDSVGQLWITAIATAGDDIWVGTKKGLFHSIDGRSARIFDPLADDEIQSIVAIDDEIWVSTPKNLIQITGSTSYTEIFSSPTSVDYIVEAGGNRWILAQNEQGTAAAVHRLVRGATGEGVKGIPVEVEELRGVLVSSVVEVGNEVWFGTDVGIVRIKDRQARKAVDFKELVNTIAVLPSGVWVGTDKGAYHWQDGRLHHLASSRDLEVKGFALIDDKVWFWTTTGVYRIARGLSRAEIVVIAILFVLVLGFLVIFILRGYRSKGGLLRPVESCDVFLSYSSKDKRVARKIEKALKARGLDVWFDELKIVPGQLWLDAVEEGLRSAKTVVILVGAGGSKKWQDLEIKAALDESVRARKSVIPVLLPGASIQPDSSLFLKQFTWVDMRNGLTKKGFDQLERGIRAVTQAQS